MKKVQRSVASGLLVIALSLGLAGCGSNHHPSKSTTSKDKVTKVSKQKRNSSVKKQSSKKDNDSSTDSNDSQLNSSTNSNSNATSNKTYKNSSSSSTNSNSQKQLGLSDVAVWTDESGVTHHVDSDGMDRQTTSGSSSITYKDWSGSLPSNAQIIHQN
ncbi:hypothetical protein [Limosilactobacillus fastidiosus]|uniref:CDP-diacylglycerol diphosphatase n=1 Tax=Limosilactobacillus fastidiosus TaxID=2759855 RepID=A0ABR6E7G9_9LACO|nr:hypothetical protein [Limosilactobacillus fastidiosus]MBB1063146.1 hypothetical protein [Limosilactobacillus fastidiosus]MCD7084916.1 hypothetical protein [Limosilactobacillus fastidiosus]